MWFSEKEHSCSSFVCPLWISGVSMLHLGNLLPRLWTQNQPHSLGLADPGSKELLLYKKLILADTKLLVLYSGLPHLIHWQEYFKDNSEAESYYWPCQRHRKFGGKRELMSKIRKTGAQHFFCARLAQWLWTKTFTLWVLISLPVKGEHNIYLQTSVGSEDQIKVRKCTSKSRAPCSEVRMTGTQPRGKLFISLCP